MMQNLLRAVIVTAFLLLAGCREAMLVDGVAATTNVNWNGIRFAPETLEEAAKTLSPGMVVLLNHDTDRPIGWLRDSEYVDDQLLVTIEISWYETKVWRLLEEKLLTGLSLGFCLVDWEPDFSEEFNAPARKALKVLISEVSIVTIPADPDTRIARVYIDWIEDQ